MMKRIRGAASLAVPYLSLTCAVLVLASGCGESSDPSSVWDDLSGTIYFIPSGFGPVKAMNPVTGELRTVDGAPDENLALGAPLSGNFLIVGGGRLFRLDMADGALNWIVPEWGLDPVVSPSGAMVAFKHSQPGGPAIRQVRADGSNMMEMVPAQYWEVYPQSWLGDSTFLFLRNDSLTGLDRIWSVRADGTGMRPVGGDTGTVAQAVQAAPSGTRLAIQRVAPDPNYVELWEATTDGQLTRQLATYHGACASELSWSPDEQYLMSCTVDVGPRADIVITHVATGTTRVISTPEISDFKSVWTARPW